MQAPTPNPTLPDSIEQIKELMKEFQQIRNLQGAFNGIMLHDPFFVDETYKDLYQQLEKIFQTNSNKDTFEFGIKHIIFVCGTQNNDETVGIIMKFLEKLVVEQVIPARLTCELLLSSDKLVPTKPKFWVPAFVLIRKVIDGVDYKGVREIMKTCLDKLSTFPERVPQSLSPQLNAVVRLLELIFDRKACLLPAYFIVNEILKSFPENKNYPHWTISELLWDFVDSFRPIAQIVTVIGRSKMLPVVEHSIQLNFLTHSWKLDQTNLRFVLKGNLPYDKELLQPQDRLLRYVLEQPYSRDMACAIVGLQKQHKMRCIALEERLVELILLAMEKTETEMNQASEVGLGFDEISGSTLWLWQHLSTQLIFFVLFQFANFPSIVLSVHSKLAEGKLFKGRDFLMWILLQFISGSIQKNPLSDFIPVLKLYDLLYPETEPIPVPDLTKSYCTSQMASTCIWIHVLKKAQLENLPLSRPLPSALKKHYEFLQALVSGNTTQPQLQMNDFRIALLCNAFSTQQELFSRPMAALVEALHGNQGTSSSSSSGNNTEPGSHSVPLSVQVLDSLTVHTKMSLIHNIVTHIMKIASTKSPQGLAPGLVETYARLLVYMEIESLGIKGFISQLLPQVYKSQAWGILHTLLEMFCYRLHHIQPHYRVQLLCHLNQLTATQHLNVPQLHLCVEMTALRLITGFNSVDVHSQLSRVVNDSKSLVSAESEELNRALVLTIARAIHVTGADCVTGSGSWFREILMLIMQNTPHSWSSHTIQCFPPVLAEYFQQNQVPKENKQQLKNMVEEEFRNWTSMLQNQNETELIEHFSMTSNPALFLCLIWKMILTSDTVPPAAYKILEKIGPKNLSAHLRKFCDYVVGEFANAGKGHQVNKCVDAITDLMWKYNIVPFDRLLLCMALRTQEGSEAQVCFFMIHLLMVKPAEFRTRIQEFIKENSPEHWKQSNWHEKHKSFNNKFPEVFHYETQRDKPQNELPVYFGNVCLRFLPVFDILIHRFLEITVVNKSLEMILDHMGGLYKFHDRPITYLYNTLHYYESRLRDKPALKKKLVGSIVGSLKEIKPPNWALTDAYNNYLTLGDDTTWIPDNEYYASLLAKFVDVIEGNRKNFAGVDWRYNEFPNPAAHVLHSTCVELMGLPVPPQTVGSGILDIVKQGATVLDYSETGASIESWFNATGLVLVSLPDPYWLLLHERLVGVMEKLLKPWTHTYSPLRLFDFKSVYESYLYSEYASLLGITHAMWHHLGTGHIHHILLLVTEGFLPIVKNEIQLLYICHLVGPFLQRFNSEKPQMVCRLTVALYELLEKVDKETPPETELNYMDIFCDLLYHIKYMFTGDIVKTEVEARIRNLSRASLILRLRFITHLSLDDINQSGSGSSGTGVPTSIAPNPQQQHISTPPSLPTVAPVFTSQAMHPGVSM